MNPRLSLWLTGLVLTLSVFAFGADKKPWKDMYLKIGDMKLHYLEAGAGDKYMILIPGWTMIAEIWKEQIPYFASRGYHVLAIDPRSQGETTKTEGGNTIYQLAADLNAFLKSLNIEHPVLVGWSMGVPVLLEYLSSPEVLQPEKIVLVDGTPTTLRQADYPYGLSPQQAHEFVVKLQEDRWKTTDQFVRQLFKSRQPELLYKELIAGSLKTPTGTAVSYYADVFLGDRRPALPRVPAPTLIIVRPEQRAEGEYMQSKIPRAQLEVISDAGSAMFVEKPQTFNQIVEKFLGEN